MKVKITSVIILIIASTLSLRAKDKAGKPNIVLVLIDDMAWSDVGYNGGAGGFYETPNIDAVAKEGIVFNRFYPGGPNCAPTRACILSGMYTPRTKIYTPGRQAKGNPADMRFFVPAKDRKGDEHALDSRAALSPSVSSVAELLNSAGYVTSKIGKWHVGADKQGFDEWTSDGINKNDKKYYNDPLATDRMTAAACNFIQQNKDKPFFLYFAPWDVHTPLVAKKKIVKKYENKWANWPDKSKQWSPSYAAMIEVMDNSVGQLRDKLQEMGLQGNTLFMVVSDNGGPAGHTTNQPLKGAKGTIYEGGIRTLGTAVWPGHIQSGTQTDDPITGVDMMPTFAELADAQLPGKQPVDGISFAKLLKTNRPMPERPIFWHYPLYMTGKPARKGLPGDAVLPIYGTRIMNWRAVPSSAIMKGDWKLIYFYEYEKYELYNLANDIGEEHDLSQSHPGKAKEMYDELMNWVNETGADIPSRLNPDFKH
ncbi:MAG: sulfatase [Marinifilum sp.]|jgi:arylsulfatase A-like enzyme|nr:sulfatase [Marinifilum sp.]